MDKNSVIGFILIAAIMFGFTWYESSQGRKRIEAQRQLDSIARAEAIARGEIDTTATLDLAAANQEAGQALNSASFYKDSLLSAAHDAESRIVALENSKLRVEFSTKGAQPYSVMVKDYYNYDSTSL